MPVLRLKLLIDGHEVEAAVEVPGEPGPRQVILPILQRLTDVVVEVAERGYEAKVSCQKGCDACCRQMVPISPTEAYALGALVEAMSAERAAGVLERFDRGRERLAELGVLGRLHDRHALTLEQQRELDRDYFGAGVACPFLEGRACGIYADRPLACREFLVVSPAEHCREPVAGKVEQLALGAKVSVALREQDGEWLPLVLARDFVSGCSEEVLAESPAEVLRGILGRL